MSEEMAKSDSASEESALNGKPATATSLAGPAEMTVENPSQPDTQETIDEANPVDEVKMETESLPKELPESQFSLDDPPPELEPGDEDSKPNEDKRGTKRRASEAFSDTGIEEFRGFEMPEETALTVDYMKVLDRLEAEVAAAIVDFTPLKSVMATPPVPVRASKRSRQDTDSSRPSSALSSRSESDAVSTEALASPASGRRKTTTTEMSSPLLRIPLERGWKRELVYRAALDSYSRRNADIYYYTPAGKKLRSMREISENLSGTGLTLENFSFFKEPLGLDDPEKEIIRDAKVMRKGEWSPSVARAPAAKVSTPDSAKSPTPSKLKVKSMGSRISTAGSTPTAAAKAQKKAPATPTPAADNNNSAAWKKPMASAAPVTGEPVTQEPVQSADEPVNEPVPASDEAVQSERVAVKVQPGPVVSMPSQLVQPVVVRPPPSRTPPPQEKPTPVQESPGRIQQPCSMQCGGGRVPTLCCRSCLCLYHPHCVQHMTGAPFLCKNCRVGDSSSESPAPKAVRVPPPAAAAPAPAQHTRVTLKMKVAASGGADGQRVWSVAKPAPAQPTATNPPSTNPPSTNPPSTNPPQCSLPQSIALVNGRRFIVVPRAMVTQPHDEKRRTRVTNGSVTPVGSSPAASMTSPRRRGRSKADDTDHFAAFYEKAKEMKYDVVPQIFQYVGMRELASCARVCKLWRTLAATPALWRHVRMKNSHVSDWSGLCTLLKRRGTSRLDLRKMLLPQNDAAFWEQFAQRITQVDSLERIELCRCPASAVEAVCRGLPRLRSLSALAIKDALLDPSPLATLTDLHELRLKSMAGLSLTRDLKPIANLHNLQHLSLTSIKELGWCACEVIGSLTNLEVLELGECTFGAEFGNVLAKLTRLKRLRLERGTSPCAAPALLRSLAALPALTRLELVNFDVKVGFDDALAECKNIQRLLIIPTYVSQSATTNKQVLSGVLRLKDTLTHLMWGVTIELLRVTELFIDQCSGGAARRDVGECIPVLKPVPGASLPPPPPLTHQPQVEILPLPMLQRLLSAQLPNTRLKLLRIPFHATWRQSLNDFQ